MTSHSRDAPMRFRAFCALLLAVFTVSAGYGIALPIMPGLVERLAGAAEPSAISRHIGLLTGLYTFSLFLFAPPWGRLSDRYGRRLVLLVGLSGCGVALLAFAFLESLPLLFAERFFSGMFAAAVTPVASAAVADHANDDEGRATKLARISMAGIAGFLLGPMLGSVAARLPPIGGSDVSGSLSAPFAAMAALSFLSALAVHRLVPEIARRGASLPEREGKRRDLRGMTLLLALAFVATAGLGVFEVGLTLRGTQALGIDATQIALVFAECSLVMFLAQGLVFSRLLGPSSARRLIAPLLALMAIGLVLVPWTSTFVMVLVLVGVVATSAGVLTPILTYWISLGAGGRQGAALGRQAAAASLGQAAGSVAGGALFNVTLVPGAPFLLAAALLALGAAAAARLPRMLGGEPRPERSDTASGYHGRLDPLNNARRTRR